jgi:hypothetical protein
MMNALRRSVVEFAMRSMAWRATSSMNVTASQSAYTVPAPTDAAVSQVLSVGVSGFWLEPVLIDTLARTQGWDTATASTATNYYIQTPGIVSLYPIPTTTVIGALSFQTALQPTQNCLTVPDFLYTYFAQAIIDGALYYLMSTPGKDYSNPELALYHRQLFETGIATASANAAQQFGRTPIRVKPAQ